MGSQSFYLASTRTHAVVTWWSQSDEAKKAGTSDGPREAESLTQPAAQRSQRRPKWVFDMSVGMTELEARAHDVLEQVRCDVDDWSVDDVPLSWSYSRPRRIPPHNVTFGCIMIYATISQSNKL